MEFRCFVKNNNLIGKLLNIGISQRNTDYFYDFLINLEYR